MSNKYVFVIDTTSYAGNFERDMCAYVTGVVGGCGVGEEYAALYEKEMQQEESIFMDLLEQRCEDDDHGCARPTSIWPTKGWFNHGLGGEFKDGDEKKALKDYVKIAVKMAKDEIENTEEIRFKLTQGESYSDWTVEYCDEGTAPP